MRYKAVATDHILQLTASAAERVVLQHIATATFKHAEAAEGPLAGLQKRELIEPYQGGSRFQVPLMQRWVLKLPRTKTQS